MSRTKNAFLVVAVALSLGACGGQKQEPARGGALVSVHTSALSTNVTELTVDVYDAPAPPNRNLVASVVLTPGAGGEFSGLISGLPLFTTFTIEATAVATNLGGGTTTYTQTVTLTEQITANGQTIQVALKLQELNPQAFQNTAPALTSLTASARFIPAGSSVIVEVKATDPDAGDTLTYAWSPAAQFADATLSRAVWTAPSNLPNPTDVTLSVLVADGRGGFAKASLVITVTSAVSLQNASVVAVLNDAPAITAVTLVPQFDPTGAPYPTQIVVTAADPEGGALTYLWDVDTVAAPGCAGDFTDPVTGAVVTLVESTVSNPIFTPTSPGDANACAAVVTVFDPLRVSNSATVSFATVAPPTDSRPVLVVTDPARNPSQDKLSVGSAGTATIQVAFDKPSAAGTSVAVLWSALADVADAPLPAVTSSAVTDQYLATFPSCAGRTGSVRYTLRATAENLDANGVQLDTVFKDFFITQVCP